MPIEKTEALVLKYVEFSESSLIVTLFSRSFGKVRALAKGARRLKNPFESSLDLLAQIDVSFIRKNSDALDLLTEAKLVNRFRPDRYNLGGMYAGFHLIDLIDAFTADYQILPELYDFSCGIIKNFQKGITVETALFKFEWTLLLFCGLEPLTRYCIDCGRKLDLEEMNRNRQRLYFNAIDGGTVCPNCLTHFEFSRLKPISAEVLLLFEELGKDRNPNTLPVQDLFSKNSWGEARALINLLYSSLMGKKPKMFDYIKLMTSRKD